MSHNITDTTTLLASSKQYTRSGIGGVGNIHKTTSTHLTSSIPRIIPAPSKGTFRTGIGGAGNTRSYSKRADTSFEDALARSSMPKQSIAGSHHHGIGGLGNRSSSLTGDSSVSSSVESSGFLSGVMARQSGADRVKGRVVSFFGSSVKRSSMVDEKDDDSIYKRDSWAKEN